MLWTLESFHSMTLKAIREHGNLHSDIPMSNHSRRESLYHP